MNAVPQAITREAYHADYSAKSAGMIAAFDERQSLYAARYITRTMPDIEPTRFMTRGTAIHYATLQPDLFESHVLFYPTEVLGINGKTKERDAVNTKAAEDFRIDREAEGKTVVKRCDYDTCLKVRDAIAKTEAGKWLKFDAVVETPRYWTEGETGTPCRCLPDWYSPRARLMLDIKSTSKAYITPYGYAKKAEDDRHWLIDSHYADSCGGEVQYLFVVAETEPPYDVAIYRYPLGDDGKGSMNRELADGLRLQLLRRIAECQVTGDWSDDWSKKINTIEFRTRRKLA